MHIDSFSLASIQIDGTVYEHDVLIDRVEIRKRKKTRPRNFENSSATRRSP
jgi:hypothetical protein